MKKLVNSPITNTIYWATVNEEKQMITGNKEDVTDNALEAVLTHLVSMKMYEEGSFAGYDYSKKETSGSIRLCAYDTDKYKLVPIEKGMNETSEKQENQSQQDS